MFYIVPVLQVWNANLTLSHNNYIHVSLKNNLDAVFIP